MEFDFDIENNEKYIYNIGLGHNYQDDIELLEDGED